MWIKSFLLLLTILLGSIGLAGQSISGNPGQDIKNLRKLSDAEYIRTATEFSIQYSQQANMSAAAELLDAAINKGRRVGGKSAAATVCLEYVSMITNCCLQQAQALRLASTTLTKAYDLDRKNLLSGRIENSLRALNAHTKDPAVLAILFRLADQIDGSGNLVQNLKETTLTAVETKTLENRSAKLESQSLVLRSAVQVKEREVEHLSLEAARQKALSEYHKKVADSLYFVGLIDSIQVVQQEQILAQQAVTIELQQSEISLQRERTKTMWIIIGSILAGLLFITGFFLQSRRLNRKLREEKNRSEELLLNILPKDVAEELKATGVVAPRFYELGTVLFTDFVGFSNIAKNISSDQLIKDLDTCFQIFDQLADQYDIEKIKTIGDAYMCIGGVPTPDAASVRSVIRFALRLQQELSAWNRERAKKGHPLFQARIGIHTGPVVAGVVGIRKFSYDIWGDTVNVASRMESQGAAGKVNVSAATYNLVKNDFQFTSRGTVEVKNMGAMEMYFVEG